MLAGLRMLQCRADVIGVSSSEPSEVKRDRVRDILPPLDRLGSTCAVADADIVVFDDYKQGGYAIPTDAANDAIALTASSEAIILDPSIPERAWQR